MPVTLIDQGWRDVIKTTASAGGRFRLVCPFIKQSIIKDLVSHGSPDHVQVITRLNTVDFFDRVSDLESLDFLLSIGARIRTLRGLHSKLYLFGNRSAIVTSANLTASALDRNEEFGVASTDPSFISGCSNYFDRLWALAGSDLTPERLAEAKRHVTAAQSTGRRTNPGSLPDLGSAPSGENPSIEVSQTPRLAAYQAPPSSFVKFFGESRNRALLSRSVLQEVDRSGSHWACTYPKCPRQPEDGSVLFISRMMTRPDDYRIYGVAFGLAHKAGRDTATEADIQQRPWKQTWPHYIRIYRGLYVAGTLENGVSLDTMMDELGHESFRTTLSNFERGKGNVRPQGALRQQPAVQLTERAHQWLLARLDAQFEKWGTIPEADLERLDKPDIHPETLLAETP